ncbi:conserved exported hypothetical protein [Capnocytophaga canis]|uniref:Peptidoglycan-binding protein LysM n=1 Tax=Capnocytophaga canis TaxID=1848903 RepID=A0A0B7I0C8_9FLAO|nr:MULTISPECIES: peptidoglycan-binding protein LysM [Capnocytophaga]ATA74922.1 peptidoglycan-binding protein LysM [Capnocytophaga sp. H2931]RIY35535.1 peptidoglycan-binding protein LysM [Capnocytophaga canis]CEN45441.1 conserved exported hypothetical protein [Capnocytophaga canis]
MIQSKKKYLFMLLGMLSVLLMTLTIIEVSTKKISIHKDFIVKEPLLVVIPPESELKEQVTPPFIGRTFVGFKEALAYRESRGNYFVVNPFGYMGKYQFGKSALRFYGVTDTYEFLNSPEQQERLFTLSIKRNKWVLREEIDLFVGKKINGINITESGILAAAHLAGAQSVKQYFKRKGNYSFADANGTTLQNYLRNFADYDVTDIIPEERPRF